MKQSIQLKRVWQGQLALNELLETGKRCFRAVKNLQIARLVRVYGGIVDEIRDQLMKLHEKYGEPDPKTGKKRVDEATMPMQQQALQKEFDELLETEREIEAEPVAIPPESDVPPICFFWLEEWLPIQGETPKPGKPNLRAIPKAGEE